jgi:hypothetical protein
VKRRRPLPAPSALPQPGSNGPGSRPIPGRIAGGLRENKDSDVDGRSRLRPARAAVVAVLAALLATNCSAGPREAPGRGLAGQKLEVAAVWSGVEQRHFELVLHAFTRRTGVSPTRPPATACLRSCSAGWPGAGRRTWPSSHSRDCSAGTRPSTGLYPSTGSLAVRWKTTTTHLAPPWLCRRHALRCLVQSRQQVPDLVQRRRLRAGGRGPAPEYRRAGVSGGQAVRLGDAGVRGWRRRRLDAGRLVLEPVPAPGWARTV